MVLTMRLITIRLPEDMVRELDYLASLTKTNRSELLRRIIERYLTEERYRIYLLFGKTKGNDKVKLY